MTGRINMEGTEKEEKRKSMPLVAQEHPPTPILRLKPFISLHVPTDEEEVN